jgi:hypothetical protein
MLLLACLHMHLQTFFVDDDLKESCQLGAVLWSCTNTLLPALPICHAAHFLPELLQTFFVDDDLKESCQLDAVLCMVDAKHITQHLDEVKPADVVNEAGGCNTTLCLLCCLPQLFIASKCVSPVEYS